MRWVEASQLKCHLDYDQFSTVTIYFTLGLAQVYIISDRCVVAMLELLASDCQRFLNQSRMCLFDWFTTFCPGFVYVTYDRILQSETKRPHHIHSLRSSCFIKSQHSTSQETLLWSWNSRSKAYVFCNPSQNPRNPNARCREESLELYSILWSDWPTSKLKVLRHGNRFAARVRRRYFSDGEKRRPEMRLALRRLCTLQIFFTF